jgi:hypothetical protein
MYVIKFTEAQLSFLFNNLEAFVESEAKRHTWYQMMDNLCWDEANQVFKPENPILLNKQQKEEFWSDMVCDTEEILRQLEMDVRYHSLNDTSWSNSKWCLEMLSDIIQAIQEAEEF